MILKLYNKVLIYTYKDQLNIIAHEIIHIYQQNDFSQMDAFMNQPINMINRKSETMNKINKYVYYDFRHLPQFFLYSLQSKNACFYYDNPFEREAGYFSKTFDGTILNK